MGNSKRDLIHRQTKRPTTTIRRKVLEDTTASDVLTLDVLEGQDPRAWGQPTESDSLFIDSAYQSMAATQEDSSETEERFTTQGGSARRTSELGVDLVDEEANGIQVEQESRSLVDKSASRKRKRHSTNPQEEDDTWKRNKKTSTAGIKSHQDPQPSTGNLNEVETDAEDTPIARASGRQRKISRKLEEALQNLTPEKRSGRGPGKGGRPRKTVPADVFSKDSPIASTPSRTKGRPRSTVNFPALQAEEEISPLCDNTPTKTVSARGHGRRRRTGNNLIADTLMESAASVDKPEPQDQVVLSQAVLDRWSKSRHNSPECETDGRQPLSKSLGVLSTLLQDPRYHAPFSMLRSNILARLTGKRRLPLVGLEEEYRKVHQIVSQTVVAGEGNSMLIMGARGCAKTTLVETAISQVAEEHGDHFHVVRLNGFIHTDDKIALKEIWRQLGCEMETEQSDTRAPTSYADTLLSLLALLSHPAEHFTTEEQASQTSKSVIFVMDEFDLFATHGRQTLLYNLFDIAQSRKAPIAVLGLTTRIDVMESLEKRVKSRFSHRYVYLPWPKTISAFRSICKTALLCMDDDAEETEDSGNTLSVPSSYGASSHDHDYSTLRSAWSKHITSLLTADSSATHLLRTIFFRSKSVPACFSAILLAIARMTPTSLPTATTFAASPLLPPDSKLSLLHGLSELEASLLVAAARLDIILDADTCNFNMAYDEYFNLASRTKMQSSAAGAAATGGGARVWSRDAALGAWERLERLELLVPMTGLGGVGGTTHVGRTGKLWRVDVALEEIGASGLDVNAAVARWCREI